MKESKLSYSVLNASLQKSIKKFKKWTWIFLNILSGLWLPWTESLTTKEFSFILPLFSFLLVENKLCLGKGSIKIGALSIIIGVQITSS